MILHKSRHLLSGDNPRGDEIAKLMYRLLARQRRISGLSLEAISMEKWATCQVISADDRR